jgi:NADH-quinone oxidoreductase subunit C
MGVEREVLELLKGKFPDAFQELVVVRPRVVKAGIDRKDLLPICQFLQKIGFDHIDCISAVDWKTRFESVYHISNYVTGAMVQINAAIPYDDPRIDSVVSVWPGANYHEREAYDLMGIVYEGHPDLRRILLPIDFQYHPLRKDFAQEVDRQYVSRRKIGGR